MSEALEVQLSTHSDRFDTSDESWLDQEGELLAALRGEVTVRRELVAAPGQKGLVEGIILALGSAGAFKAAVDCLRAWLGRDRTRRIELAWTVDGREERFVLQGTAIPNEEFEKLAELLRAKAAGSS